MLLCVSIRAAKKPLEKNGAELGGGGDYGHRTYQKLELNEISIKHE